MTPASSLLREFRLERNLSQKQAAYMLGCKQSFLSAVETGISSLPRARFKSKLIKGYNLSSAEISQLEEAVRYSNRKFYLPYKTSQELFWVVNAIFNRLDNLSQAQVNMIALAIKIND